MSTVVAIAGGTGGLGRTITEALKADGRYEILILSRKANPKFEEDYKTRVVDANSYSNVDQLTTILEENNIAVVISIFNGLLGSPEELNLIEAADRSRTTKRFIPSLWSGLPFTGEHIKNPFLSPHAAGYQRITEVLRKKSLEFAAIHPGDFMDYYVPLPTHVTIVPLTLSLSAKFAAIPGSGNVPVSFTHTSSTSKYIAQLLAKPPGTWQQKYFISDDNKTWNEVVALAEKYKGVKFKVVYDSMEKIRGGKVTEVPGIEVLYKLFGGGEEAKTFVLGWLAAYAECIENGEFHYKDGPLLSEEFGNVVEKLTFEKAWEKVNNNV